MRSSHPKPTKRCPSDAQVFAAATRDRARTLLVPLRKVREELEAAGAIVTKGDSAEELCVVGGLRDALERIERAAASEEAGAHAA